MNLGFQALQLCAMAGQAGFEDLMSSLSLGPGTATRDRGAAPSVSKQGRGGTGAQCHVGSWVPSYLFPLGAFHAQATA